MWLTRFILGRPLANREGRSRKLGAIEGVPALGLDGLASSAYGPEAALTILLPLGLAGSRELVQVMLPIIVLLAILYISYRQTIAAYPGNGGAYSVAKENLGTTASLLAAAALMVDYVLNVAVAISAGVGAVTSAAPVLQPYGLVLCLALLSAITLVNLRGTMEASRLFGIPTYIFIASFITLLALGLIKSLAGGAVPATATATASAPPATQAVTLWILLRSFAAGCTAMTGVEAVSNGVSVFRAPVVANARRTLAAIVAILAVLLAGIAYLSAVYGIVAKDQSQPGYQSVLSQLTDAIVGRGAFYDIAMGSAVCILCLSANTSFADFPRLCRLVAQDGFLPSAFATVGRRLVFSVGILYLSLTAGTLLIVFAGITDRLIPLFAVGAFLTFTLSQAGMVVHWRRAQRERPAESFGLRLVINSVGATATAIALIIIVAAKFLDGAWITIIAVPLIILLLKAISLYYRELYIRLRRDEPLRPSGVDPPIVLVPIEGWNRLTARALSFAIGLSPEVIAVHLNAVAGTGSADENDGTMLRKSWARDVEAPARAAGIRPPRLEMVQAPYRSLHLPMLKLVDSLRAQNPARPIAVLISQVVKQHWWQHILHTHRAMRLRSALLRYGGSRLIVMSVPWYIEEPDISDATETGELHHAPDSSGRSDDERDRNGPPPLHF
jgi:amino acid transporter